MKTIQTKLDANPISCFSNVQEYSFIETDTYAWNITYEDEKEPIENSCPIYFILDSNNHSAFSHWVYENCTWIPHFLEIQKQYPSCQLVLENEKQFKHLFLNYFNIPLSSITYHKDISAKNVCFFHTYVSLNDPHIPAIYYTNLEMYHTSLMNLHPAKDIPILYLPRGTKENHKGPNNRIYNVQNDLKRVVKELGGIVYETDTTTSLEQQIVLVKRANCVILDYGSNLWVNGLFAENSLLLCLNIGWKHHELFPSLHSVWKKICLHNTIKEIFAYPVDTPIEEDGVAVVHFHMPSILHELLNLTNTQEEH